MYQPQQALRDQVKQAKKEWDEARKVVERLIVNIPLSYEGNIQPIHNIEEMKIAYQREAQARIVFMQTYAELAESLYQERYASCLQMS